MATTLHCSKNSNVTIDVKTSAAIDFVIYHDKVEIVDALTGHVLMTLEKEDIETLMSLLAMKKMKVDSQISKTESIESGKKFIFTVKRFRDLNTIMVTIGDDINKMFLDSSIVKELPAIMKMLRKLRERLVT